jgi:hypothetical protein
METSALETLLAAGEFRAADDETRRLLLADADDGGFVGLDPSEVPTLDCALLLAIDEAWAEASNGRYGLTAQSEILAAVRAEDHSRKETWRVFGTRVGWFEASDAGWFEASDVGYSGDADVGHLPWIPGIWPTVSTGRPYEVLFLFYRHYARCMNIAGSSDFSGL